MIATGPGPPQGGALVEELHGPVVPNRNSPWFLGATALTNNIGELTENRLIDGIWNSNECGNPKVIRMEIIGKTPYASYNKSNWHFKTRLGIENEVIWSIWRNPVDRISCGRYHSLYRRISFNYM